MGCGVSSPIVAADSINSAALPVEQQQQPNGTVAQHPAAIFEDRRCGTVFAMYCGLTVVVLCLAALGFNDVGTKTYAQFTPPISFKVRWFKMDVCIDGVCEEVSLQDTGDHDSLRSTCTAFGNQMAAAFALLVCAVGLMLLQLLCVSYRHFTTVGEVEDRFYLSKVFLSLLCGASSATCFVSFVICMVLDVERCIASEDDELYYYYPTVRYGASAFLPMISAGFSLMSVFSVCCMYTEEDKKAGVAEVLEQERHAQRLMAGPQVAAASTNAVNSEDVREMEAMSASSSVERPPHSQQWHGQAGLPSAPPPPASGPTETPHSQRQQWYGQDGLPSAPPPPASGPTETPHSQRQQWYGQPETTEVEVMRVQ